PQTSLAQERGDYYTDHRLDIPPGHYPPPGECKLWFPNRPPGQQPPPTDCAALVGRDLGGAVVLYHGGVYDPGYQYDDIGVIPRIIRRILGLEWYEERRDRDDRGRDDRERHERDRDDRGRDDRERPDREGYREGLGIPPGHYPPPGECRIWYAGRPPGQQPPPVPCRELYGGGFGDGVVVLYDDVAWDPYGAYDWEAVPEVIRRLFR
ncbi:MAG TPA: hypothetical protein VGW38_21700, partial [Chloroflexota bacterium]|nr:hypothetical protein [Chloroflexota bacterium]